MSFSERRRAVTDAAFATFGETALWSLGADAIGSWMDKDVLVWFRKHDEDDRFGPISLVTTSEIIRVRSWEVEEPALDDLIEVRAGPHAGSYAVKARPMLDDRGVWHCPVENAA